MTHEKIYLFDAGVFHRRQPGGRSIGRRATDRRWRGGICARGPRSRQDDLFYWRTRAGTEVACGESGQAEVKNHRKVHSTDLRALRSFREDYPDGDGGVFIVDRSDAD